MIRKTVEKFKEFLLGTSIIWLPLVGCYIANAIANIILK